MLPLHFFLNAKDEPDERASLLRFLRSINVLHCIHFQNVDVIIREEFNLSSRPN